MGFHAGGHPSPGQRVLADDAQSLILIYLPAPQKGFWGAGEKRGIPTPLQAQQTPSHGFGSSRLPPQHGGPWGWGGIRGSKGLFPCHGASIGIPVAWDQYMEHRAGRGCSAGGLIQKSQPGGTCRRDLRAMPCLSFPKRAPWKMHDGLREALCNSLNLNFPLAGSFTLLNSLCNCPFLIPLPSRISPALEI